MFRPEVREPADSWAALTTGSRQFYLGGSTIGDGTLLDTENAGWSKAFTAGETTEAKAVDAIITTGQAEWKGHPKIYVTGKFDRQYVAVWTSAPLSGASGTALRVRGIPNLRLTIRSTAPTTTLVAYLFDVDTDDSARIITHEPYTLTDLTPGQDRGVEWKLQAASYDIASGHRLMLVIGSEDALYSNANVDGSTTTVSSLLGDASRLEIPLG